VFVEQVHFKGEEEQMDTVVETGRSREGSVLSQNKQQQPTRNHGNTRVDTGRITEGSEKLQNKQKHHSNHANGTLPNNGKLMEEDEAIYSGKGKRSRHNNGKLPKKSRVENVVTVVNQNSKNSSQSVDSRTGHVTVAPGLPDGVGIQDEATDPNLPGIVVTGEERCSSRNSNKSDISTKRG
jgi:hypothetical protein